jgi:hypothetical protein
MEPMQAAAEDSTTANGGADVHHEVIAVLHARPLAWWLWLGYFFVVAPVTAVCAGLLDGPWAAATAYAVLLLGIALLVESASRTGEHHNSLGKRMERCTGGECRRTMFGSLLPSVQCPFNDCYKGIYMRRFTYRLVKLHCDTPQRLDSQNIL